MQRLILPLFFGILGTAILLWLGSWQVQRLAWKEGVLADINARMTDAPVAVPASPDVARDQYLPVVASGLITTDEIHVLASSKQTGAIYRVIAAFETADGRRLLLDRGWIKPEAKDTPRPEVATTVTGNLHWPDERDGFTPDADTAANIWFAREVPEMAAKLGTEPVLIVARATDETRPDVTPMPVTSAGIPNDHLQYAVTWFGLALVWVAMTLYYLRRMRIREKV
ncbi:SURF1 family protein [Cognatishimia sp. SS12]|uniref:SURF1 family protein n=1 Tax=Cognatishimia sp. SS12 TaxID=2979465 RepID=UPI00232BECEE|nr:SURF1 family protein [Cognatishimia sp. SS12]MDC0736902.1 SURF1 family protein [Cognatishimia sp. SS12]